MRVRTALAALLLPVALAAQATVQVPMQDPVYRDLDRLFDAGLVKTMLVDQRPYSRREIARIVTDASSNALRRPISPANQKLLARLLREYATDIALLGGDSISFPRANLRAIRAELLGTNSPKRAIPPDSLGTVQADLNPLLDGRAGRTFRVGTNAALESEMTFQPARSVVFDFQPRVVTGMNDGSAFAIGELESLNGTVLMKDIAVDVGRQQSIFGQGIGGGLVGSTSSRPLDMVRIANDTPFYAPGVLHFLGPLRGTAYVADLGPNQTFPHSLVIAYKLAGNPFTWRFELSATVMAEEGGKGAPGASLRNRIIDLIPILQYTLDNKDRDQISNKFAGVDWALRIPEVRGARLYAEAILDDADPRRWGSTFWQDAGYVGGLSLADLGLDGALSGTFEYHHTGLRYYEHTPFTSGLAFNRVLLGDPLGNEADGGYLQLRWDTGTRSTFELNGAIERRYGNVLATTVSDPEQDNFRFVTLFGFPPEWRHRATASWIVRGGTSWRATIDGGYERVRDFSFVAGASRNNFLFDTSIELLRW